MSLELSIREETRLICLSRISFPRTWYVTSKSECKWTIPITVLNFHLASQIKCYEEILFFYDFKNKEKQNKTKQKKTKQNKNKT